LTENGIVSLTAIVAGVINQSKIQISDKIRNLYASYARSYGSNYGWQGIIYEAENAFVVNVPVAEDGTHYQLVMNTITGSWCRFTGWDAENFVVFNKQFYYTRSTKIATAWDRSNANQTDEGSSFNPEGVPAFTTLKTPTKKKVRGIFCSLNLGAITGSIFYDAWRGQHPRRGAIRQVRAGAAVRRAEHTRRVAHVGRTAGGGELRIATALIGHDHVGDVLGHMGLERRIRVPDPREPNAHIPSSFSSAARRANWIPRLVFQASMM
jgi:hypothetical protein